MSLPTLQREFHSDHNLSSFSQVDRSFFALTSENDVPCTRSHALTAHHRASHVQTVKIPPGQFDAIQAGRRPDDDLLSFQSHIT